MNTESFISKLNSIIVLLREQTLMQKQVFNSHEAALYLKCSLRHIYHLSARNKIPCYKVDGRRLYFSHSELQHWLLSQKKTAHEIAGKPGKVDASVSNTR